MEVAEMQGLLDEEACGGGFSSVFAVAFYFSAIITSEQLTVISLLGAAEAA